MKRKVIPISALVLALGGGYAAQAQDVPALMVYGISADIAPTPSLKLNGGQFIPVENKLRITDMSDFENMRLMNEYGEEFLLEQRNSEVYVGGEIRYSEKYMITWPNTGKYLPVPVTLKGPMNIGHINFATGSATLDAADRQILSAMADEIEHTGLKAVYMVGHADSVGSYEGNLDISLKRVITAKNYLKNHLAKMGITDVQFTTEYMGDLKAKSTPDAEDRRVEVTIYPKI